MATSIVAGIFAIGQKDVASAGTAVALDSARRVDSVVIIAKVANTGKIFYGGSDVASATQAGLAAGESISLGTLKPFDLADIFIDSSVNGEGADFVASLI